MLIHATTTRHFRNASIERTFFDGELAVWEKADGKRIVKPKRRIGHKKSFS